MKDYSWLNADSKKFLKRGYLEEGESPEDGALEEIRIYVPVQQDVDPEMDESPTLGAGQGIRKRG